MIVPKDPVRRLAFYLNLIQDCNVSRSRRQTDYENRMRWYLFGDDNGVADTNKIKSTVDTLSAFLFTGESVSFGIDLDDDADDKDVRRAPSFESRLNKVWHDSNIDALFGEGVTRSLTYNSMFLKLVPRRNDVSAYLVEPGSMGVLREDVPGLDRQEAFTHQYWMTMTELYRRIKGRKDSVDILTRVTRSRGMAQKQEAGPIRAFATAVPTTDSGNLTGQILSTQTPDEYLPQTRAPQTRITELWLKDDEFRAAPGSDVHLQDYRMVQIADPDVIIYDGPGGFLPHEHNFIQIAPEPLYSYFWAIALISFIRKVQDWRNDETWNIRNIMEQQFDPPRAFMGFDMMDEANYALGQAGASISSRNPNATVKDFRPPMPPDIWGVLNGIDQEFADASGLQELLQGKGGGKNAPHAGVLAQLGAARLKKMSGSVEDSLDQAATKMFKIIRAWWTDKFYAVNDDGSDDPYLPSEFTDDAAVHVDGHSQSAVFNQQMKEDADLLIKAKAIDRRTYIEMLNPPNRAVLLRRLKKIEADEAAAAQQQHQLEMEKAKHRQR